MLNDGFCKTNQTTKRRLSHPLGRLIEHEAVTHITTMQAFNRLIDLIERKMLHLRFDGVPHAELHHFSKTPRRRRGTTRDRPTKGNQIESTNLYGLQDGSQLMQATPWGQSPITADQSSG